jgi:lipopolysaccharide heptosyltransferase I
VTAGEESCIPSRGGHRSSREMSQPDQRFLIIRLSSVGDIVHTLPAVTALGEKFPEAEIHWVIEKRHAPLLEGNPYVRRVVKLDTLGWRKELLSPGTLEQIAGTGRALREISFDVAVDFQGLIKSAVIARLSRSHERLGFAEYWLREPAAGILYTERVTPRGCRHVIELNFSLIERLGVVPVPRRDWKFPLPHREADERDVESRLASLGAREFIVISPGGGWKSKCWAPEKYAGLIRQLEPEITGKILLTGSPEEEPLIAKILQSASAPRAAYFPSTILQLIALARRARLFAGGDTGPVHLAEAVGTPVVMIFNAGDPLNTPERNGPFRSQDITVVNRNGYFQPARNRNADFLRDVSVESVLAAIRERLARAYG